MIPISPGTSVLMSAEEISNAVDAIETGVLAGLGQVATMIAGRQLIAGGGIQSDIDWAARVAQLAMLKSTVHPYAWISAAQNLAQEMANVATQYNDTQSAMLANGTVEQAQIQIKALLGPEIPWPLIFGVGVLVVGAFVVFSAGRNSRRAMGDTWEPEAQLEGYTGRKVRR
jgi:hypothetical protein